ncbi:MAG: hypothetical protein Q9172_006083 [Xanthocarpia lactea]
MTVVCKGETIPFHSAIVCPRSGFFEVAFYGGFKVGSITYSDSADAPWLTVVVTGQEGLTKTINLSEDSLPMVRRMMKYFYFLDYFEDEDDDQTSATFSELELHVQMFSIGDKYDIICLKNMAAIKFRDCCEEHNVWDSVDKRKAAVKTLVSAVPAVYKNTPDDDVILRPPLVNTITERLNKDSALLHELKDMCLQYPKFSYDLMEATWRVAHPEHGRQCWGGSRGGSPVESPGSSSARSAVERRWPVRRNSTGCI